MWQKNRWQTAMTWRSCQTHSLHLSRWYGKDEGGEEVFEAPCAWRSLGVSLNLSLSLSLTDFDVLYQNMFNQNKNGIPRGGRTENHFLILTLTSASHSALTLSHSPSIISISKSHPDLIFFSHLRNNRERIKIMVFFRRYKNFRNETPIRQRIHIVFILLLTLLPFWASSSSGSSLPTRRTLAGSTQVSGTSTFVFAQEWK